MANKKVAILGGGVAGLTAAHELMRCGGFDVEVFEKADTPGGKAKSNTKPNSGTGGRKNLPGEHGFRFFPGFYVHVPDTMSRIPFGAAPHTVVENLVAAPLGGIAQEYKPLFTFPTHAPRTLDDWRIVFQDWFARDELGLQPGEALYFITRLLTFMATCEKRRFKELEKSNWWDYIGANTRSMQYRKLLARGLTRSLVAMRAEDANTRTVASILVQMIMSMTSQSGTMDRVLNAPTSDAWITPWVTDLTNQGVKFTCNTEVVSLLATGTNITSVTVRDSGGVESPIQADYYIAAFPIEVAQKLLTPLGASAPSLGAIKDLRTEWMNGLQIYLTRDVPITPGHVICADSSWAVTAISQQQFWPGDPLGQHGDGTVKGLISIDISDWTKPGTKVTNKPADQCTEDEIVKEVFAQIRAHLAATTDPIAQADFDTWFLDPSISFPGMPPVSNSQPLLINTAGSWANRPNAQTEIANLFLASDYVRTNVDLATMEGANEAARRAVNALLGASGSSAQPCQVWTYKEPAVFEPLKQIDEAFFNLGLPNPGFEFLQSMGNIGSFLGFI
ncbi:MAG: FAD-dependent oxidoreductase [Reyranella sp.]|jgi:15-cis-phytoene desaturase|nr:FAD-dependent oxidoreductase [Reyranella sp.]